MRTTNAVRLLPVLFLMLASVGCENQQAMLDAVQGEKAEIEKRLTEVTEKVVQLVAENETLQSGVEAAKAAAAQAEEAASQAKAAAEEAAAQAKTAAEEALATALATAKQEASDALSKAMTEAEAKMASAATEAKNALDAASAKVAELDAALKKAQQATPEEAPAE